MPAAWLAAVCGVTFAQSLIGADPPESGASENEAPAAEAAEAETEEALEEEEALEFSEWRGGNPEFSGWFHASVGGVSVQGNEAEFRRRLGVDAGLSGGVSEFFWESFVGENGTLRIGGQVVGGNEDYDIHLGYENPEKGYLRVGASRRRTWSDAGGGFYPPTAVQFPADDRSLYLDRGKFWIEGGLTGPDRPTISVRYERSERFGDADSTIWGATPLAADRGVSAAFRGIDETRDIVTADVSHSVGQTDVGLGVRYERAVTDNTLNFLRDAGVPAQDYTTQSEGSVADLVSFHAHAVTRLRTNTTFSSAYSFTRIDTGVSGSRIIGASFDPLFDPSLARFPGFVDLQGGSRLEQHVIALNVHYLPLKTLSIVPSVRAESVGLNSDNYYTATPGAGGVRNVNGGEDFLEFSERLEVRYSGLRDWVLYGRGDWDQVDGGLAERQTALATGAVELQRDTDFDRFTQKYTAGANWYPARRLNLSGQYFYKRRDNDYDHLIDTTGVTGVIRHPAYLTRQEFSTHDFNVRMTLRPSGRVVSVSRYDFQVSEVRTGAAGAPAIQSGDLQSHVLSQSLTWTPSSRIYLQGLLTYVHDTVGTPANSGASGAIVPESRNNYWSVGANAGYVLNARTDVEIDYLYSLADNFVDNSLASQPYGAGFEEHRVVVTMNHRLSENARFVLDYGFFHNDDASFGGDRDYVAHLVSSTYQRRF